MLDQHETVYWAVSIFKNNNQQQIWPNIQSIFILFYFILLLLWNRIERTVRSDKADIVF